MSAPSIACSSRQASRPAVDCHLHVKRDACVARLSSRRQLARPTCVASFEHGQVRSRPLSPPSYRMQVGSLCDRISGRSWFGGCCRGLPEAFRKLTAFAAAVATTERVEAAMPPPSLTIESCSMASTASLARLRTCHALVRLLPRCGEQPRRSSAALGALRNGQLLKLLGCVRDSSTLTGEQQLTPG